VEDPELGTTTQIGVPINLHGTPGAIAGPQPMPGQHNTEVFGALGYSDTEIHAIAGAVV
jgi:crotonobetainyl-CoA:carnitine CoA-transferase CaiB-like acyl-CoA transferase